MIYPVVVKKITDNKYIAFCLAITSISAFGKTIDDVINKIQNEFFCRLHDRNAQIDVIFVNESFFKNGISLRSKSNPTGNYM